VGPPPKVTGGDLSEAEFAEPAIHLFSVQVTTAVRGTQFAWPLFTNALPMTAKLTTILFATILP
jgi:hypothetical protein